MKKEDIFRYINRGKRKEHYLPTEKKNGSTFIVELYSYTGKVIKQRIEKVIKELKQDLHIVFKPTKTFTKKSLKGVDKYDLLNLETKAKVSNDTTLKKGGTHTLQDKSKLTERKFGKEDESYIDYFGTVDTHKEIRYKKPKKVEKRITLLKADGTIVGMENPFDDVVY